MADQLDDEISADELAALLGQDVAPAPPPDPLPSQAGEGESGPLGDVISADELAALGLTSPPSKASAGGNVGAQFIAPNSPSPAPISSLGDPAGSVGARHAAPASPGDHPAPPVPAAEAPGPNLPQLTAQDEVAPDAGIGLLMDVPLRVSIELGRISMTLQQVLGLGRGSIIELERLAGEPVDILVNDKLIGRGEVVVIDEYFGVKITELIDPKG